MKKKCKRLKKTINKFIKIAKKTKIWWTAIVAILASCGSTKVAVSKPAEGTSTTITVTTNNPITTTPTTTFDLNYK